MRLQYAYYRFITDGKVFAEAGNYLKAQCNIGVALMFRNSTKIRETQTTRYASNFFSDIYMISESSLTSGDNILIIAPRSAE